MYSPFSHEFGEYIQDSLMQNLQKIVEEIATVLQSLPYVKSIALFGSIAENRADEWSDVDMLVCCDDVDITKWDAALVLRKAKPVMFYRPFTSARQPSGRYWFEDESPFNKLDISFDNEDDYNSILNSGGRLGHDITAHKLFQRTSPFTPTTITTTAFPLIISEQEQAIGNYIYQSLRSLKHCHRGIEDTRGFENLKSIANKLSPETKMSGGDIGKLLHILARIIHV